MNSITASQLRAEGIAAIEKCLALNCEAVITVRGEEKFVVIDMQRYNYLRECELDTALHETQKNYKEGKFMQHDKREACSE